MFQVKEVRVNGLRLHTEYINNQSSQNVLFIHGLSNASLVWKPLISQLNPTLNYYIIDLPGCGQSEGGMFAYDKSFYTSVVEGLCEQLSLQNLILVGHSMGGQIAIHVALHGNIPIQKMVLLSPAGFELYHYHERKVFEWAASGVDFFKGSHSYLSQALHQSFYHLSAQNQQVLDAILAEYRQVDSAPYQHMLSKSIQYMCEHPVLEEHCQVPTLLLFGKNDELIPNRILHPYITLKQLMHDAALVFDSCETETLEQCGHFIHVEKYQEVANLMRKFLFNS